MWGKLTDQAGPWAGLKVNEARKLIVAFLESKGMIEKVNAAYAHRVATCYRCHSVIEPMPLPQFFVSVKPLTEKVLQALKQKKTKVHGAGRDKILVNWLTNLRDWNISRQIVWGIRLPIWYEATQNQQINITFLNSKQEKVRGELGQLLQTYSLSEIKNGLQSLIAPKDAPFVVSKTEPGEGFIQETDTFDTWFSSGQWPVVTLKIREGDFETFYPTSVMETGYDILPFWVMRMYLLGMYLTDKVPFADVYLHGLIRDAQGRKMSKSVGNVINPLDMVEKYGADAIRMALVMGSTPGQDKSVGEQTIKGMRNFSNKIWNATRYVSELPPSTETKPADEALNVKLSDTVKTVTENLDKLKVGQAAEDVYSSFWHWFCDEVIESHKRGEVSTKAVTDGMKTFLSLLHPFAPFVTEASYQAAFAKDNELLITGKWPSA
jgi:valyl-tRNA synthetase